MIGRTTPTEHTSSSVAVANKPCLSSPRDITELSFCFGDSNDRLCLRCLYTQIRCISTCMQRNYLAATVLTVLVAMALVTAGGIAASGSVGAQDTADTESTAGKSIQVS